MESKDLKETFYRYLRYFLAKDDTSATSYDRYMALAYAVRSEMVDSWIKTTNLYREQNVRRVYYLSMEYVFGKNLRQNMVNLGIEAPYTSAVRSLGFPIEQLYTQEDDFELGYAGKGRAAVCSLESLATLGLPAMAYGLRYDYAQFQQDIKNGAQVERPYDWLHRAHPWEIVRPEYSCSIGFAGECFPRESRSSLGPYEWAPSEQVHAIPYDVPIPGYQNNIVNTLRLWSARASEEFLPDYANHGDYVRACEEKSQLGRITRVLFPEEDIRRVTELRMKQQFFFVSAALQDIIRRYKISNKDLSDFDKKVVIHLNGSRCALAIPELMRIFIDNEKMSWDQAWKITRNVFAFTSNAVLKENLESWPVYKVAQILPRHMQILFDINQIYLEDIRQNYSADSEVVRDLSLIEEGEVKRIRLANLAVLSSFSVNGVSREQSEILKRRLFPAYATHFPEKFCNKTVGISHRRWLLCANPDLSNLITSAIGDKWIVNPMELMSLEKFADDSQFLKTLQQIKQQAKDRLAESLKTISVSIADSTVMYDIQCGKIHPYKRQVLHILHILHRYLQIKSGVKLKCKRLHVLAGKASPSDFLAKQIIHLINVTKELINKDPEVNEQMQVVFVPNFGMSWAERVVTSADLSEHIATASLEAAGTFNMKFAFNGAYSISSRCGSNLELAEKVGLENISLFGKTSDALHNIGSYKPQEYLLADSRLKNIFELLETHLTSLSDGSAIYPLISSLRDTDRYFVLIDFDDYLQKQDAIEQLYSDPQKWSRACLMNIARAGYFSSDRTTLEYAHDIWKV